jgi:hypothetical protein
MRLKSIANTIAIVFYSNDWTLCLQENYFCHLTFVFLLSLQSFMCHLKYIGQSAFI